MTANGPNLDIVGQLGLRRDDCAGIDARHAGPLRRIQRRCVVCIRNSSMSADTASASPTRAAVDSFQMPFMLRSTREVRIN